MQSIHGVYENGKIKLKQSLPRELSGATTVLITFVDDETDESAVEAVAPASPSDDKNEAYYESIREFERVKAHGNITIIDHAEQHTFPLNDYSQGGLSFISDQQFAVGNLISAGITDPGNPDLVLMELKMEVRGIFKTDDDRYKIGCMFLDPVDEDLWHGLLQYLG